MKTKVVVVLAVLLAVALGNTHPHLDPIITHIPKAYDVNIDEPAITRWAPIIRDYAEPLRKFMYFFDLLPFSTAFLNEVEHFAHTEFKYQDFVTEVDAIAKLSGYPFDKIFLLNFMYEYSTIKACTGVIVRTDEGKIMHGRNLDFPMWELLAGLVANVHYYRNGKLLFSVDSIIGSVFTLTANKPGAFSVEVNTRTEAKFDEDFINVLLKNAIPTCWLLRKVVEEETTYAKALARLSTERIGGPVYFVVSGLQGNEGAVIERDNDKVHALYQLTDSNWFLVQTNYDRDQPDPVHDQRRLPAEARLRQRGNKNFKEQDLFDTVMSKFPTMNIETILTVVMVSSSGYHNTTVWYGQNPTSNHLLSQ
jgi:hypothetical protein